MASEIPVNGLYINSFRIHTHDDFKKLKLIFETYYRIIDIVHYNEISVNIDYNI